VARWVHPVAAAGFSSTAELYERVRPSYPPEAIDWLVARAGLVPGTTVVDVGAGTGKLTRLLVATGARVVAVEPLAEMRAALAAAVPGTTAIDGTAEDLPLPDGTANTITCAQAFHWFDLARALPELHRALAADGLLVLIWNTRDLDDPLQNALEDLIAPYRGDVSGQLHDAWRPPLEASALFGTIEQRSFRNDQIVSADEVVERVATTSFVAVLSPEERKALLGRVRTLVARDERPFPYPYRTDVYVVPRLRDQGREAGGTPNEGSPPHGLS
jgi:SAM-dependent methyltransferase